MEVEKNTGPKVSFGTTLKREIYPVHVPHTRFGNDMLAIKGQPNLGPGVYNNEEATNFEHEIDTFLTSKKGYTLGARTAARFKKSKEAELIPPPHWYQTKCTDPIEFQPAYKPFNGEAERFPVYKRDIEDVCPGPGTYEHDIKRFRKVDWHQSFGTTPINLPSITQHSTIDRNTEKLLSTKEEKKYYRRLAYLKLYY